MEDIGEEWDTSPIPGSDKQIKGAEKSLSPEKQNASAPPPKNDFLIKTQTKEVKGKNQKSVVGKKQSPTKQLNVSAKSSGAKKTKR